MAYLQLADSFSLSAGGKYCTCPDGTGGWCASGNCSGCCKGLTPKTLSEPVDPAELYVFIPTDMDGGGKWVREDYFDKFDDATYDSLMNELEPFQSPGTSGFFSRMRERRDTRRSERQARKRIEAESKATARVQRSEGGGIAGKLVEGISSIFGGQKVDAGLDIQSGQQPTGYFRTETYKPIYEKPLFWVGVVGVTGTVIYFATRKKRR